MLNLVDDGWIPVQGAAGEAETVSLRTALLESDRFIDTAFPAPTLMPAVLRQTLLPVLIESLGHPRASDEWSDWFAEKRFTAHQKERINTYLDDYRECFELFSEKRPFAQVPGLSTASNETKTSALLIPSVATGNNVPLFSGLTEGDELALPPAAAAWWLLHAHCWDTAAIKTGARGDPEAVKGKGKTTGNPTGPLGQMGLVLPLGATLYETLLLNLPPRSTPAPSSDRPQWRVDPHNDSEPDGLPSPASPRWAIRPERGPLDLLTWQSRRIRLIPEQTEEGLRVKRVVLCAGDRLSRVPEIEPHTGWVWTAKPPKGQQQWRPRRHRAGRALWQGLESLLTLNLSTERESDTRAEVTSLLLRAIAELHLDGALPAEYPLRIAAVGMVYGNQSAIVENVITDRLPLPQSALLAGDLTREMVCDLAEQADALAAALNRLHANLRRAAGADPLPWDQGQHAGEAFLHAVDPLVRRALTGIQRHAEDDEQLEAGMAAWETAVWRIAEEHAQRLSDAAAPDTFLGREIGQRTYSNATATQSFRAARRKILTREAERRRPTASTP